MVVDLRTHFEQQEFIP